MTLALAALRPLKAVIQNALALSPPRYVQTRVLAANVPETITVPTGANFCEIRPNLLVSYAKYFDGTDGADPTVNGTFAADASWTKGTNWTIAAGVATKAATNATALSLAAGLIQGQAYYLTFDMTRSAGSLTPSLGGTNGTARSSAATFSEIVIAGAGGDISFTADASFAGTVDNVLCVPCAAVPAADVTDGMAAELIAVPTLREISGIGTISVVAPATTIITIGFWN